jgi:MFS transporter, OFA family, oxalate/formate antiporter
VDKSRRMVVVSGIMIMLCLGVAYSWGVFLVPLENDMGWGRAQISLAVSILLLVFSAFMSIGGISERKFGPRITATVGGLLVGCGWIGASFSKTPQWMYLFYGVLGGMGTGLAYIPSVSCGIKWFPEKKGLVTGVIVFGFGFGAAFLSPVITYLINLIDWRATMLSAGAVLGLVIISFAQFLKAPVCGFGKEKGGVSVEDNDFAPRDMIRTASFKTMFITYFIAMVAGMMTIGHVVAFAQGKGFDALQGALALTILSVFNGIGRILAGHISDLWGGKRTLVLLFGMIGSGMFLFYHASGLILFYVVSALIGLCFGGFLAVYPPLTSVYFGREHFAVNYGLVFIGYGSGCFLGPLAGGLIYDNFNSYRIAFYFSGMLAILGGIIVRYLLKEPIRSAD